MNNCSLLFYRIYTINRVIDEYIINKIKLISIRVYTLCSRHIYWVDTYLNYIDRCDYDGKRRRTIVRGSRAAHHYALSILETTIFATSWQDSSVLRVDRYNSSDISRYLCFWAETRSYVRIYCPPCFTKHYH